MGDGNLMCETVNCGQFAEVFGLRGTLKVKACHEHSASFIEKGMRIIEIAGYDFISNRQEADDYEERKALAAKGRGNLGILIIQCDKELDEAFKAIEEEKRKVMQTVESRFEEIKLATAEIYTQVKAQLEELQKNVEQFLRSKESQLLPAARLACMELTVAPKLLKFGISDVSDLVSAELNSSWEAAHTDLCVALSRLDVFQKNVAINDALEEAKKCANKGILGALQYADSLIGRAVTFDQARYQAIRNFLEFEKRRIGRSSEWLINAWDLRQKCGVLNEVTVELGIQTAKLLYYKQGKFSEAEQILYYFHCSSALQSRPPADSMTLCNDMLEVYFARAEYQKIELSGLSVLQTYQPANLSAELYWTTLLYVTYSLRQQGKDREASDTFEEWRNRIEQGYTKLAEMLRLLTSGIDASFNDNRSEAEECLQQALRIGTSHFPTSTFTALACFRLTVVCEENAREQHHLLTKSLYEAISPKCAHAALNLTNMGVFLFNKQRPDEAEEKMTQAQSILEIAAPKSAHAGKNLTNLGILQYMKRQWKEAEKNLKKAESILNNAAHNSVDAAINCFHMGMLYEGNNQKEEAIEKYSEAARLYGANNKREKQLEIKEKIARLRERRRWWELTI